MLTGGMILYEGGGNHPAAAVPLVALGTQNGTIDVIDVSANAVAASFSVHSGTLRGLRWLGNSRLVSFSYSQVYDFALNVHYLFNRVLYMVKSNFYVLFFALPWIIVLLIILLLECDPGDYG